MGGPAYPVRSGFGDGDAGARSRGQKAIKEKLENGRDYYALRGQSLKVLPAKHSDLPSEEYLAWHNERVFVARGA